MDCTHVERFLPLFVEGELTTELTASLQSHLFVCQKCSESAAEFEASREWLRSSDDPDFDQQFFAELRGSVWQKIEDNERPWFRSFHWGWAAAFALLVLFAGVVFFAQLKQTVPLRAMPQSASVTRPGHRPEETAIKQGATHTSRRMVARHRVRVRDSEPRQLLEPALPVIAETEQTADVKTLEAFRIEIHTADPSIRIIWLVAGKHAADPDESDIEPMTINLTDFGGW